MIRMLLPCRRFLVEFIFSALTFEIVNHLAPARNANPRFRYKPLPVQTSIAAKTSVTFDIDPEPKRLIHLDQQIVFVHRFRSDMVQTGQSGTGRKRLREHPHQSPCRES